MPRPIDELAAPGSATCRATAGLIAADAVQGGAFHFNLRRRGFVMRMTDAAANSGGLRITTLAASGVIGILIGMTLVLYALPGCKPASSPRCPPPRPSSSCPCGGCAPGKDRPRAVGPGQRLASPDWP